MQIQPTGWTNPAAQSQQVNFGQRASVVSSPATAENIGALEESNRTGDRDANERYEGPPPDQQNQGRSKEEEPELSSNSNLRMTDLPADDGFERGFDIVG